MPGNEGTCMDLGYSGDKRRPGTRNRSEVGRGLRKGGNMEAGGEFLKNR